MYLRYLSPVLLHGLEDCVFGCMDWGIEPGLAAWTGGWDLGSFWLHGLTGELTAGLPGSGPLTFGTYREARRHVHISTLTSTSSTLTRCQGEYDTMSICAEGDVANLVMRRRRGTTFGDTPRLNILLSRSLAPAPCTSSSLTVL
jgi:hypothetical protein